MKPRLLLRGLGILVLAMATLAVTLIFPGELVAKNDKGARALLRDVEGKPDRFGGDGNLLSTIDVIHWKGVYHA